MIYYKIKYFKAKELFKKGLEIVSKIPDESDVVTLRTYETEILGSTKYLVEAFLRDEKATEMSPRIMTLAQQYEKLLKLESEETNGEKKDAESNLEQDQKVETKKSEKGYPAQDGHDNLDPEFTRE